MKKLGLLLLVLVLLVATNVVFARDDHHQDPQPPQPNPYDQHKNDDGILVWDNTGDTYSNTNINRGEKYLDVNSDNAANRQEASIKLKAEAYIPCYIKLELKGNQGIANIQSFGPGAKDTLNENAFYMLFDNEVGGFVNGSWLSLGHGKNAEIAPGSSVYIQACDTFKVDVYSNDNYKYVVKGKSLENKDGVGLIPAQKYLKVQMGTSASLNGTYSTEDLGTGDYNKDEKESLIFTGGACAEYTAYHKFRVPYSENVAHGKYEGTVTFSAYTI
jgi:hypothetical protein